LLEQWWHFLEEWQHKTIGRERSHDVYVSGNLCVAENCSLLPRPKHFATVTTVATSGKIIIAFFQW